MNILLSIAKGWTTYISYRGIYDTLWLDRLALAECMSSLGKHVHREYLLAIVLVEIYCVVTITMNYLVVSQHSGAAAAKGTTQVQLTGGISTKTQPNFNSALFISYDVYDCRGASFIHTHILNCSCTKGKS